MIPRGDWLCAVWYPGRLTHRGIIPRGDWLAGVSYPGESGLADFLLTRGVWYPGKIDSQWYHTPGRLTRRGMIHRGDWLAGVWYPRETDSLGYDTLGRQIFGLKIRITQRILNQNIKYFNPLVSGTGSFELWKKNWGQKSRWTATFSLFRIIKQHLKFNQKEESNIYLPFSMSYYSPVL